MQRPAAGHDDEQVAVVRDGVRQQVEGADGEVLAFQRIGQGVGEALFAVVRRVVAWSSSPLVMR